MNVRLTLAAAAALVGVSAVPAIAQSAPHERTIPKVAAGAFGGSTNALPFGRTQGFIQTWYRGDSLPIPHPITTIGWRAARGSTAAGIAFDVEVLLTSTTTTFSTLSPTFANNLGTDAAVVFARRVLTLPNQSGAQDPNQPVMWMPLDRPFIFLGPHLIVQTDVQTSTPPAATPYFNDAMLSSGPLVATFLTSSPGCGGLLSGTYATGNVSVTATGATPNAPVSFLLGADHTRFAGVVPLPYRLDALGMTGCLLGVDPLVSLTVIADGGGAARLTFPYAIAGPSEIAYFQGVHASAATPAGLATTNVLHAILGGSDLIGYVYNWTVFGPTAQYGPYASNRGSVMLIRP